MNRDGQAVPLRRTGSSPQARAQAWAAVMTVAAEEGAEDGTMVALPLAARQRRWPRGAGRPVVALVAAVVVCCGGDSRPFGHQPCPPRTGRVHYGLAARTPGEPGGHLGGCEGSSPRAFRLVSYIEGPQWQKGDEQVPPGYLDCPAVDACYVLAQTALTTVGPYPNYYNAVYFSGDGGASWSWAGFPARPQVHYPAVVPE